MNTPLIKITYVGLVAALVGVLSLVASAEDAASLEKRAAALEGGRPCPEGAGAITFPWMGKQSIMAVGDAEVERMVAMVDFSDDAHAELGKVTLDGKGSGTASFTVKATDLKTGHTGRDEKLITPSWIDAKSHPDVTLKVTSMQRVKPTVWKATGTWTMNGIEKPVEFLLNARWVGAMQNVADDGVVRISGSFPVALKDYNIGGQWAGTPACAAEWIIQVVLIGVWQPAK